jgi:hypothetical protein
MRMAFRAALLAVALGASALGAAPASRAVASEPDALAAKAGEFRARIHARHLAPEGVLLYRVELDTIASDLATGAYPELADGPTFTGLFAGAACARAESTSGAQREEALADAALALSGIELQMRVTGSQGLLARTVRRAPPDAHTRGEWHEGRGAYAGWYWRGDVSLDQYANGLVSAIGLCRRLFPERAHALAVDAASHLIANDFRVTDPDGERTRYGDLSWRSGLGWNSIAQLTGYTIVSLAAALAPDQPRFLEWRDRLRDRYRVVARAGLTNLRVLGITSHSNDLMAFNLYRVLLPLARETGDPAEADVRYGLYRGWLRVRDYQSAYFDLVFCSLEPESCDLAWLARARAQLATFPLEKRNLGSSPEALSIPTRLVPGRKWKRLARELVPIELRPVSSFEWKSSPYRVEGHASPNTEYTGLDYLVAFWLYESVCSTRSDCPAADSASSARSAP